MKKSRDLMVKLTSILLIVSLFFGCAGAREYRKAPKLKLPSDIDSSPAYQRVDVYEKLSVQTTTVIYGTTEAGVSQQIMISKIILGDGTRIINPNQLMYVVPADSISGKELKKKIKFEKRAAFMMLVGLAGVLVSVPFIVVGDLDVELDGRVTNRMAIAGVGSASTFGAMMIGGFIPNHRSNKARDLTFLTYNDALLRRLNLCISNDEVIDCSAASSATLPAAEPASTPSE